ncbi:MAG: DUF4243 domain-containing protein [Acidimicrobiia bacterium]|nr:DUF4243 domain-containing protein [Acidimicrobiia bacterium]
MTPLSTFEPTAGQRSERRLAAMEDALDRLDGFAFSDGPGMAVHAPMGAEALCSLGLDDLVPAWVEGYRARHAPIAAPARSAALDAADPADWRDALGDPARLSDWAELFSRLLQVEPWQAVLARWVPRLISGFAGALTHGLLRTAHAVRALDAVERPGALLLHELAMGLGYWAGTYKALPGPARPHGELSLADAVDGIPRPSEPWGPMEAGQFQRLPELPHFAAAVADLAPPRGDDPLGDLTLGFARVLLANPDAQLVALVHTITPAVAVRTLLPHVPDLTVELVYAQLWQVNAGLVAGFLRPGAPAPVPPAEDEPPSTEWILDRVAAHRDAHVVKLAEACLREHARRPDPAYLLTARHVLEVVPPW